MINQTTAGIYTWLPLGLKVLQKIENIKIIDFSGENLFDFIYQNTNDATYFIMPNLISNFSSFRKSIESIQSKSDDVFLKKNYFYNLLNN